MELFRFSLRPRMQKGVDYVQESSPSDTAALRRSLERL